MSNFEYVMSFKTNRHAFLFALNLPDNAQNKKSLFKMALYLNNKQWNSVFDNAGEGAWYFEKVKKAIFEILHAGDCHLMLKPPAGMGCIPPNSRIADYIGYLSFEKILVKCNGFRYCLYFRTIYEHGGRYFYVKRYVFWHNMVCGIR